MYMESRKMVLMNLLAGSRGDADVENRLMDTGRGEEGEGEMYGESNMEIYNTICKTDSRWECPQGTQIGAL